MIFRDTNRRSVPLERRRQRCDRPRRAILNSIAELHSEDAPTTSGQSYRLSVEEEDQELISSFGPLASTLAVRNALLASELRGQLILAPLTRANHLPFRRWCMELGCKVTMSEMAFAKQLLK